MANPRPSTLIIRVFLSIVVILALFIAGTFVVGIYRLNQGSPPENEPPKGEVLD